MSGSSSAAARRTSGSVFVRKIMTPSNHQQTQPSYIEVFIPPRASIVNYFMAKVKDFLLKKFWNECVCLGFIG
jgi:hypothetical protein